MSLMLIRRQSISSQADFAAVATRPISSLRALRGAGAQVSFIGYDAHGAFSPGCASARSQSLARQSAPGR
jgi:hypothetical protein